MTSRAALQLLRWIYVAFIVTASATTLLEGLQDYSGHGPFLVGLASTEIVAALLFLVARTEMLGCALLLAVFAVAAVFSTLEGDYTLRFAYYAATALFIVFERRRASAAKAQ